MDNIGVLKSCPFCGGHAKLESSTICAGHGESLNWCFVKCIVCGARGPSVDDYFASVDTAIVVKKWNTRLGD